MILVYVRQSNAVRPPLSVYHPCCLHVEPAVLCLQYVGDQHRRNNLHVPIFATAIASLWLIWWYLHHFSKGLFVNFALWAHVEFWHSILIYQNYGNVGQEPKKLNELYYIYSEVSVSYCAPNSIKSSNQNFKKHSITQLNHRFFSV